MRALTVAQPWASLIMAGVKTIETRPAPPNGPMRPEGVRGLPGLSIAPGERIAIHAAAPERKAEWNDPAWGPVVDPDRPGMIRAEYARLPFGAVLGTVQVVKARPILLHPDAGPDDDGHPWFIDHLCVWPEDEWLRLLPDDTDLPDQLPLGDFTPGRWGWVLKAPNRWPDPVPARGRQGVWEWTPNQGSTSTPNPG
jgi:hypothetical protein